ncbi:MAG: hypothetical protein R6W96_02355, partial [Clostridia bacterium]
ASDDDGSAETEETDRSSACLQAIKNKPWFVEVDMSGMISEVIDRLNYDISLSDMFEVTHRIKELESYIRNAL